MISEFPKPARLPKPVKITEQVWPEGTRPTVSIISWVYNHERFLGDAIEGFLMQETTFPVEIILHDDASTDLSVAIIREYEAKYPRLFRNILRPKNMWKRGINVASEVYQFALGEFIALCEGDDYWTSPHKLQKQVEILERCPEVSLVFHNAWIKHPESTRDRFINSGFDKERLTLAEVISRDCFVATASKVVRRSVLPTPHKLGFCHSGDVVLQLTAALHGEFHYINQVMSVYRQHDGGVSDPYRTEDQALFERLLPNLIWMNWCWYSECCPESHLDIAARRIGNLMRMIMGYRSRQALPGEVLGEANLVEYLRGLLNLANPGNIAEVAPGKAHSLPQLMNEASRQVLRGHYMNEISLCVRQGSPMGCARSMWRARLSGVASDRAFVKHSSTSLLRSVYRLVSRKMRRKRKTEVGSGWFGVSEGRWVGGSEDGGGAAGWRVLGGE